MNIYIVHEKKMSFHNRDLFCDYLILIIQLWKDNDVTSGTTLGSDIFH